MDRAWFLLLLNTMDWVDSASLVLGIHCLAGNGQYGREMDLITPPSSKTRKVTLVVDGAMSPGNKGIASPWVELLSIIR